MNLNPENKCFNLLVENSDIDLKAMFELQQSLQERIGCDPQKMTFMERIQFIKDNWTNLTTEYTELLERLPWKPWKQYSDEVKAGWTSEEQMKETMFEYIDMFHFFMNIGLALGIKPQDFINLYAAKNKENFARQDRGY